MKNKILAVMLSAILTVTMLVGCGDSVETVGEAETTETDTGKQETDNSLETETEAKVHSSEYDEVAEYPRLVSLISFQQDKQVATLEYEYDGEDMVKCKDIKYNFDGSIKWWYEFEYDAFGNVTKLIVYDFDGNIAGWNESKYEYDTFGNVTKSILYNSDGSIIQQEECEYEYDTFGNMTKYIRYYNDAVSQWEEYEYDALGNMTKNIQYNSDGSVRSWEKYEYDNFGNMIKYLTYNSQDEIMFWKEYEYDTFGNMTKYIPDASNGNTVGFSENPLDGGRVISNGWCEYEYDTLGNMTKYTHYNPDGSIDEWLENEYDATGNLEKGVYKYNDTIQVRFEGEYDLDSRDWKILLYRYDNGWDWAGPWIYDMETHSVICSV